MHLSDIQVGFALARTYRGYCPGEKHRNLEDPLPELSHDITENSEATTDEGVWRL